MTRWHFLTLACAVSVFAGSSNSTLAQTPVIPAADACLLIPDAIIPLKPPAFNSSLEWRRVMGREGMDRITEMVSLADGGIIGLGDSVAFLRSSGASPAEMYITRVDDKGRVMLEKRLQIKNYVRIAGGAILKDKIVTLSHIRDEKDMSIAQVDIMDATGTIAVTAKLSEPGRNVFPADVIANADGATLTVAVTSVARTGQKSAASVLYKLDGTGKILSRREYMLGVDTRIESLRRLSGGQIAVAGRIMSDGNRSAGWLMIVSRQGDMIFQRPYARGSQAQLNKVIDDGQGGFYAVGESIPADGGYRAAWVMRLSQSGEPIWQRFLRAKYRYNGSDIALEKDGRAMVLMAGRPAGDGGREHARIVSFSSNGDIVYDESYIEGSNSLPTRLTQHSVTQKRIMAGFAQTGFATDSATEERKLATYDAWIAGLPVLPAYHDPCAPKPAETLDDLQ